MNTHPSKLPIALRGSMPSVAVVPAALTVRHDLIRRLEAVPTVDSDAVLDVAAEAAKAATAWLRDVERARKEVKAPFAAAAKEVDRLAEEATKPLEASLAGLRGQMDDYVAEQAAAAAKAEAARRAEAARIEAEREREARRIEEQRERDLAKAKTDAARLRAEEKAQQRLADAAAEAAVAHADLVVVTRPAKPDGLSVRREPCFEVLDLRVAYAARPDLFDLTPKASAVKTAMRSGIEHIPGMRLWWETNTSLRTA